MSDLALTDERRGELLALLEDKEQLHAEHPQLAEYLQTAPRLAGTGDERADAAFDLRLVHFLTKDADAGENPYWAVVAPSVTIRNGFRKVDNGAIAGSSRLAFAQMALQDVYAYAIPSPETIAWIDRFAAGRTIIEKGAGRGYWAAQLRAAGLDVAASDAEPPERVWSVVSTSVADQDLDPGGVLFLCWPPGWGDPMAHEALESFEAEGGERLIYIGEQEGGKTASPQFFERLTANWELASTDDSFVSWWNLADQAQAWTRKT